MRAETALSGWRVVLPAGALACVCVLAAVARAAAAGDDPRIARIRAWYTSTEKALSRNRVVRRDLAEFASQGAVLTAWFGGDSLTKVNATSYVEGGRTTDDFYVHDDSVYFVSHIVGKYFLSVDGQLIHRVQYRMYFDHDTLIRWVDSMGKNLSLKSAGADSTAKRNLEVAKILIDCAKIEGAVQACVASPKDTATAVLAK
jgi:hypothetical protein